ncbi:Required for respiratory growth protein 9, mitochondrial [Nakaseomyces bracarensis]|uniref:Required for respiratory growth protein 9, mitochondrial n=1 Tax=Nakaseomyces bracarensis TaxID=273131 RepID=A0ABR4NNI4_9SACH
MLGILRVVASPHRWYSQPPKRVKSFKEAIKVIERGKSPVNATDAPEWKKQIIGVKKAIGNQRWSPSKRLSREEIESLRLLKRTFPNISTRELSEKFKVSPEAIRRILKSNWEPTDDEWDNMQKRWKNRGERINMMYAEGDQKYRIDAPFQGKKIILKNAANPNAFTVKNHNKAQRKPKENDSKVQKLKERKLNILEESLLKHKY